MTIPADARLRIHARTMPGHGHSAFVRFLLTPKGLLTALLLILLVVGGRVAGPSRVAPGLAGALATAVAIDAPMLRWRHHRWRYPGGAVLTALLVSLVVSVREPWHVFAAATFVGVAAKHALRTRAGHVFNPAALGLVAVFHLADAAEDWWGALTAIVPGAALPIVIGAAATLAWRVNKLPLMFAFLISCFAVSSAATFVIDPGNVAELFIWPDLLAVVFVAGVFITDPPTAPPRYGAQIWCGIVVGVASATLFLTVGSADYLLEGVLIGNAVEAVRRWRAARRAEAVRAPVVRIRPRLA